MWKWFTTLKSLWDIWQEIKKGFALIKGFFKRRRDDNIDDEYDGRISDRDDLARDLEDERLREGDDESDERLRDLHRRKQR